MSDVKSSFRLYLGGDGLLELEDPELKVALLLLPLRQADLKLCQPVRGTQLHFSNYLKTLRLIV